MANRNGFITLICAVLTLPFVATIAIACYLAFLAFLSVPAHSELYQWINKDGVRVFSNAPPPNPDVKIIKRDKEIITPESEYKKQEQQKNPEEDNLDEWWQNEIKWSQLNKLNENDDDLSIIQKIGQPDNRQLINSITESSFWSDINIRGRIHPDGRIYGRGSQFGFGQSATIYIEEWTYYNFLKDGRTLEVLVIGGYYVDHRFRN